MLIVGALLDRGNKNYDNYFGDGKKRKHDGEIVQQNIEFLASQCEEFNPVELAVEEALPETVICCCGKVFQKNGDIIKITRAHIQNFCQVFADWRPKVVDLRSDSDL